VQIGSNPFIGSLQKSTIELDRKNAQDRKTSKYKAWVHIKKL